MEDPYANLDPLIKHRIIKKFPFPGKEPIFYATYRDLIKGLPLEKMTDITAMVNTPEIAGASHIIQGVDTVAAKGATALERRWIYGGIKVAHVHVDDRIYLFNDKQWAAFSADVSKRMTDRINKAHFISLENLQILDAETGGFSQIS